MRLSRLERTTLVLVLALLALLAVREIGSPDAGYHLAAGRSMLDGDGWPRADTFTHSIRDRTFLDTTWGYEVLLALSESLLGSAGMVLLHVFFVIVIFALAVRTMGIASGEPPVLLVLLLLGGLAAESRFEVRPELLSYVFFALMLDLLQRRSEGRKTHLWLVALSLWAWSNSHSVFVVGYGLLGIFNLGLWLQRRRLDRGLLLWSAISVALTFVNPYGWRGPIHALGFGTWMQRGHALGENIGEFESPFETLASGQLQFYLLPTLCLFALIALVLVSIPLLWRQRRFSCILLALLFVPLSLSMVRNAPLFAIACLPGSLWALSLGSRSLGAPEMVWARIRRGMSIAVLVIVMIFGLRVYNDAYYVSRRRLERFGLDWNAIRLPVEAAEFVKRAPLPGSMLNHLNVGGYLVWAVPDPVFIDGRLEVFGGDFFLYYRDVLGTAATRESCVEQYDIGWTIFPYDARPDLLTALSDDRRWHLVYVDDQVVIFVRSDRSDPGLVDDSVRIVQAPQPPLDLGSVPGLGVPRRGNLSRYLQGIVKRQTYPVEQYRLGVFHYLRGDWPRFAGHMAQALRESGGAHAELYRNLGAALEVMGNPAEARRCYSIALEETPPYMSSTKQQLRQAIAAIDASASRRRPQR